MADPEYCPKCGSQMSSGICLQCTEQSSRIIQRDVLLLVLISALAVAIFLFTRSMAAKERHVDATVAAYWFREGTAEIRSGDLPGAVDSFRKATSSDGDNRTYALALANALAQSGDDQEARRDLLRLRESSPENPEINLYLARLEAKSGDASEAVRYYHNALYGVWTGTQADQQRRTVRIELIHFLLARRNSSAALSELLALAAEIPEDDVAAQTECGQLFLQAGDAQHALRQFRHALSLSPDNPAALSGAGQAAFQQGDYAPALRYLEAAITQDPNSEPVQQLLMMTQMILSNDPLALNIPREERNRRVIADFKESLNLLQSCLAQHPTPKGGPSSGLEQLSAEALAMQTKLTPKNLHRDPELLRSGMALIYKIEEAGRLSCGEPKGLDQALLLIGRRHRGTLQ